MVWLIGNKGMLGSEIARQLTENNIRFIGTDRDVDITSYSAIEKFVKQQTSNNKITYIINCAAYTAVDNAEDSQEIARVLNAEGPKNIAKLAKNINAKMIHISTDYVFGGKGTEPYKEDTKRNPLGVYGSTKADGERAIEKETSNYYIFRTAWLYGFDGKNFVYTMTKLMNSHDSIKVISDQQGTPTYAGDLAHIIVLTIQRDNIPFGYYHVTNLGHTNWYEFAKEIYKLGKKAGRITSDCVINACSTAEYPTKAERPAYSVLDKTKVQKTYAISIPQWQESLKQFITNSRFKEL
ncbi:MAG: dTDP-4-dehydrorhamnose reductase [Treponema sp. CETP13]|nr:MAG: dTDP-4-dehydrorhamnose reductase [Treponema sp. CETP13]